MMDKSTNLCGTRKRTKCNVAKCDRPVVLIIGLCTYCTNQFCMKHRIPETHECIEMDLCKKRSFHRNEANLLAGKCVAVKI